MPWCAYRHRPESIMTVCPIAIVAGCGKCPIVRLCPLKTVLGDFRPEADQQVERKVEHKVERKAGPAKAAKKGGRKPRT